MKKKNTRLKILIGLLIILILGIPSYIFIVRFNKKVEVISDLAYDYNKFSGYEIYLPENNTYVPYLVLTNNYQGNTLLLRKKLMDKQRLFNDYLAVYENSIIDNYLNSEYLAMFPENISNLIVPTDIEVTPETSLYSVNKALYSINRKAFLLSFREVGYDEHLMAVDEGIRLKYFENIDNRIAYRKDRPLSWWLRTPYIGFNSVVWSVGGDGVMTEISTSYTNGIRPAFCLPPNTKVTTSSNIIEGETVYILDI